MIYLTLQTKSSQIKCLFQKQFTDHDCVVISYYKIQQNTDLSSETK